MLWGEGVGFWDGFWVQKWKRFSGCFIGNMEKKLESTVGGLGFGFWV